MKLTIIKSDKDKWYRIFNKEGHCLARCGTRRSANKCRKLLELGLPLKEIRND